MFRLYFTEDGFKTNVVDCITPVDTLEEAEIVATLDCRRIFKNPELCLEYVDDLIYNMMLHDVKVGGVKIRSIGENVPNPIDKR